MRRLKAKLGVIQFYRTDAEEGKIIEDEGIQTYTFKKSDILTKFIPRIGQKVLYKISEKGKRKAVSIRPYAYD